MPVWRFAMRAFFVFNITILQHTTKGCCIVAPHLRDSGTYSHFRISEENMDQKDFYLYIDGKPVKVTEEVYHAYYHAEDKERYFMGKLKKGVQ